MIHLQFVKHLIFSAASGLIKVGDTFYSVSDDQLSMEAFKLESASPHQIIPLLTGILPSDPVQRKLAKPDLEALIDLDKNALPPFGGILAIPSGSTGLRSRGALIRKISETTMESKALTADFSNLYQQLNNWVPELNIEGAIVTNSKMKLFQRGNGANAKNGVFDLDIKVVLTELLDRQNISSKGFLGFTEISLPTLDGRIFGFTDACGCPFQASPDSRVWFLAASEDSQSTFHDGPFLGAMLGCLDADNRLVFQNLLNCPDKPEGLWIERDLGRHFYVVTDSDDSARASSLYCGTLPNF